MRTLLGVLTAAVVSSSAMAADLAVRVPVLPRPPAPVYNWTGIYLGVNGGYMWGQQDPFNVITDRFDELSTNISGGFVGGTIGGQVQVAHVVLGLEADLDWANVKGSAVTTPTIFGAPLPFTINAETKIPWISTARSRVGYAQGNWLFYVTAGAAIMGNESNLTTGLPCGTVVNIILPGPPREALNCSGTKRRIGGALGGGVEVALNQSWSVKAEYLYIAAASLEVTRANQVRFGLNYRFGGY
jgi:outer membrane immunogenic protein